jgi:hypothetical protein
MNLNPLRNRVALLAAPLLLSLGACATPFNANVSRFQAELPAPAGQTFAVVPQDPRNAGGLEFAQYAGIVAAQLQKVGYVPAASPQTADLVVQFDYGVDRGRDRLRNNGFADPFWGGGWGPGLGGRWGGGWGPGWGGWGPGWGAGVGPGWGPGWGAGWGGGVDVVTVYTSGIDLKIDRRADGKRLFEGKAETSSNSNRLPYLVPKLVEAMFTRFPGSNGETVKISIAPEKKKG